MGPVVFVVLLCMFQSGLLGSESSPDAINFPEIDPSSDAIVHPSLSVRRSTVLLRRHAFIPTGILGCELLTLCSVR